MYGVYRIHLTCKNTEYILQPAGHSAFDAAQDTVGFLGCERTLLGHVELLVNQHPQVLLRAALTLLSVVTYNNMLYVLL